jgi:hypothetical protein
MLRSNSEGTTVWFEIDLGRKVSFNLEDYLMGEDHWHGDNYKIELRAAQVLNLTTQVPDYVNSASKNGR